MGITNLLRSELTELVFENRNRQYGAYVLRKQYSNRLFIACISGISIIVLLVISPLIANSFRTPPDIPLPPNEPVPIHYPPPAVKPFVEEVKKQEQTNAKPPASQGASLTGQPVDQDSSDTELDPFAEFIPGAPADEPTEPMLISCPGPDVPLVSQPEPQTPERYVDDMPAFMGNYKEWLSSHLKYPSFAKDMGVQGTVYVEFVVDEEGNVSDAKLLRDIGHGCGEAALKAVRSMPKWKPGSKNGKKVKVYYTLPVKFSLR